MDVASTPAHAPERIVTDTVVLLRHAMDQSDAIVRAVNESFDHLHPWMPWAAQPATKSAIDEFLAGAVAEFDAGQGLHYVLLDPATGVVVGCAGLHARGRPRTRAIGYWVHVDWTRRGIAMAAARALTELAFGLDGVTRVEIHCDERNVASASVPRALGFRLEHVVTRAPVAPAESGREMVWALPAPAPPFIGS
jgi:RimJ/RimL family protein N-acetyltransferase